MFSVVGASHGLSLKARQTESVRLVDRTISCRVVFSERVEWCMKNKSLSEKTVPMGIDNSGFLLERLGNDCHPLQLLREFTQNSIEAILKTKEKKGTIIWDYDPELYQKGYSKLSITDTGCGMFPGEMVQYLNHLSSSSSVQSLSDNYGLGAKISAASKNPYGLIYKSWVNGEGYQLAQWKDPKTGQYGIRETLDGKLFSPTQPEDMLNADKKKIIRGHGTKVIFMGAHLRDNTMDHIGEFGGTLKYKARYLNDRFWQIPEGITIKVREYGLKDEHTQLREIYGQRKFLEQYKLHSGSMKLSKATVHWYITKDVHFRAVHDYATANGFVAALNKNELYDFPTGPRGRISRLQEFGISFGYKSVYILVEPESENLTTDTARTFLKIGDTGLPWAAWAEEFRNNLPKELKDWVQNQYTTTKTSESEINRLLEIEGLFAKTSRYLESPDGDIRQALGLPPREPKETEPRDTKGKTKTEGTGESEPRKPTEPQEGKPKNTKESDKGRLKLVWPEVRWVKESEDEALKDRAAKYIGALHEIHANRDFRLFKDIEMVVLSTYKKDAVGTVLQSVSDKVFEWYGQFLKEVVMGVKSLGWAEEDTAKALTEEALTAAMSMKYAILQCIERDFGKRLITHVTKETEASPAPTIPPDKSPRTIVDFSLKNESII
jgi:hypothetical protein